MDGPAGIGKSRLVFGGLTRIREPDDLVIVGYGVEASGGELPYGTISETLGTLVREEGVDAVRVAAGEATSTLSALCAQLGGGDGAAVETLRLFAGYVSLFESLAANRLAWLVVEDLQ